MALERVDSVPSFDMNNIMFSPKLEHSFDDAPSKTKTTLKNELLNSFGIDAARIVELDLFDEDSEEDEGEVMLLAMILLQLNGVKFPGGFPLEDQGNKKKRQRTNPDQLAILEQIFQTDKMPSQQTRIQLADQLGMSSRRVQIWFQNKRAKVKRGFGKSSDGVTTADDSPQLDLDRDNSASPSSCLSEPSSPLVPDSSFNGSPTSSPALSISNTPSSPSSAVVPCSPSLPQTPKQLFSQAAQLKFSLSALAQPIFSSEFSTMSSLARMQGV